MTAMLWKGWCVRAADAILEVCPGLMWGHHQLTVATDFSGSGSAQVALRTLETALRMRSCTFRYVCDITPESQQWLQHILFEPMRFVSDASNRQFGDQGMWVYDIHTVPVFTHKADLDIYVCNIPCQFEPFDLLFVLAKSVATLRPRIVVVGNIGALRSDGRVETARRTLGQIIGYQVIVLYGLSNHQFGIPHYQPRHYIVMLRSDAVRDGAERAIRQIVLRCQETGTAATPTWPEWLDTALRPVVPMAPVKPMAPMAPAKPMAPMVPCACSLNKPCNLHKCNCCACQQGGHQACEWRQSIQDTVSAASYQAAAANMLEHWRIVRHNRGLTTSPGYFELAQLRGLPKLLRFVACNITDL